MPSRETPTSSSTPTPTPDTASTTSSIHSQSQTQPRPHFEAESQLLQPNQSPMSRANIMTNADKPLSRGTILVKHGKYVLAGAAGCWWLEVGRLISETLEGEESWVRKTTIAALVLHGMTVLIFLYLVAFLPWLRGYIPNYPKWQQSARLRVIVPLLTGTIFLGWTCMVISLSQAGKQSFLGAAKDAVKGIVVGDLGQVTGHRGLGIFASIAGATAVYTLTLGLLGLIPTPRHVPTREKRKA